MDLGVKRTLSHLLVPLLLAAGWLLPASAARAEFVPSQAPAELSFLDDASVGPLLQPGPSNLSGSWSAGATNPAEDPWVAFDAYDDRSLIENTCNREAKESYHLERHPKRSEAGVRVQAYFVFFCMALVSAFRAQKASADQAARRGADHGVTRYRRELEMQNRDKVAVFIGPRFGIFRSFEFGLLAGVSIREREILGDTVDSVLLRCGVVRPVAAPPKPPHDPHDTS